MLTQNQIDEMKEAARPLVEWLRANATPYDTLVVGCNSAELLSGTAMVLFNPECD